MRRTTPIRTLLEAGSFTPEEINMLVSVFDDAMSELQLNNLDDPALVGSCGLRYWRRILSRRFSMGGSQRSCS
jgi:hypothetical protein